MSKHVCSNASCPPGVYYVTCQRVGRSEVMPVLGPFGTHADALAAVAHGRAVACEYDPKCHWDAFGTVRTAKDCGPGLLNDWGLTWQH